MVCMGKTFSFLIFPPQSIIFIIVIINDSKYDHTFEAHPDVEAFLEAAERTPLPLGLVYLTLLVFRTCVPLVVLHRPLKEALNTDSSRESADKTAQRTKRWAQTAQEPRFKKKKK